MIHGHYGEYKILVDGRPVIEGGLFSTMGILPSGRRVVESVRSKLRGDPGPFLPDHGPGA